ncbi:MAG: restriction endonuclease [Verrucomicrobiaceae bacterium]|nr:restriction endonuclease [Verrucomicrobiaceae bacterium]
MPIPPVTHFRVPLLQLLGDGQERPLAEAANALADVFKLTDEERSAVLPSGYPVVRHRTGWSGFHLRKAGLVDDSKRGILRITDEGQKLLAAKPTSLSESVLMQFPKYQAWRKAVSNAAQLPIPAVVEADEETSPEEAIANGYATLRANLAAELLERIMAKPSGFFEKLVVDLLLAMGYGGSRAEAGTVTKASGDGGIDGVINEDRLGLDAVYVQAKRWEGNVGVGPLREFVGSLSAHKAQKGVFITTSDFAAGARHYVSQVSHKIVLINGQRLAELMIDYGVGVSTRETYVLKRADEDYFAEA